MTAKIALQLWSVQDECEKDFVGTLAQVKKMGYDGVEFAGYHGMEAEALRQVLDRLGLEVAGSHISYDLLKEQLIDVIAYEKILGNQRIIVPFISKPTLEEWEDVFDDLAVISQELSKHGLSLYYHNHAHEFTEVESIDLLNEMTLAVPSIKLEADTYWAAYAGKEVVSWLEQHHTFVGLLHIKDMLEKNEDRESTEIGSGVLPISEYVAFAKRYGLPWLIVEQEAFQKYSPMESAKRNQQQLRKIVEG